MVRTRRKLLRDSALLGTTLGFASQARWAQAADGKEGGLQARIEAWQLMTSTASDYRVQATIAVRDGGRPMLNRTWDETIRREGT